MLVLDSLYRTYCANSCRKWHGFFQAGTNFNVSLPELQAFALLLTIFQDGPAFVNQCPIAKGNSYLYDFTATDQGKMHHIVMRNLNSFFAY